MLDCPEGLRGRIADRFQIPSFLFNRVCRESNGFSGCKQVVNDDGTLQSYSTTYVRYNSFLLSTKRIVQITGHDSWSSRLTTYYVPRQVSQDTKHMVPRSMDQKQSSTGGDGLKLDFSCTGNHRIPRLSCVSTCPRAIKAYFNSLYYLKTTNSIILTHTRSFPS